MDTIFAAIDEFSQEQHGSSNYGKDEIYVKGKDNGKYAPLSFLMKKIDSVNHFRDLLKQGFIFSSYDLEDDAQFFDWYKHQFSKKVPAVIKRKASILYQADHKQIFNAIEVVHDCYNLLRKHKIVINNKNLPTQIGEWYAKSIFGLKQMRSTSQRGFDFFINNKHVEVKVHWNDKSSPKGVKLRKSLVKLSDHVIIMYVAKDFTIRDICFLDSDFVNRKFDGKGHTIFLKDGDLSSYFFSNSSKHYDKVVNRNALMKFATPIFAMKLEDNFK